MIQMMGIVLIIIIILNLGPYWHTREHCLGTLQWKEIIATTQRVITQLSKCKTCKKFHLNCPSPPGATGWRSLPLVHPWGTECSDQSVYGPLPQYTMLHSLESCCPQGTAHGLLPTVPGPPSSLFSLLPWRE